MTENPLALRSIDTLGVRHRRDAYATLDAGSQLQRVHIKLARPLRLEIYAPPKQPGTPNRAARSRFRVAKLFRPPIQGRVPPPRAKAHKR